MDIEAEENDEPNISGKMVYEGEPDEPLIIGNEVVKEGEPDEPTDPVKGDEEAEVVVTIGDESPPSEEAEVTDTQWLKDLRRENREKAKRIRELEGQLKGQTQEAKPVEVGPKPTLEGAEYDTEKFEADYSAWLSRKSAAEAEESKKREQAKAHQDAWQATLANHGKLKEGLKVSDYDDAEAVVTEILSVPQLGMIVEGMQNSAVVLYALGKNPTLAKELASITNPVKFVARVAVLEKEMKVTPRKTAPLPDTKVSGSGRTAVAPDGKLAKLEAEADRTGDRTALVNYKRQMKAAKAA